MMKYIEMYQELSEDNIARLSGPSSIRAYFRTVIALGKVTQYHLLQDKTPFQYLHANVNQVHTGTFGPFKSVNVFIYDKQQHTQCLGKGLARKGLTKILSPKRGTIQSKSIPELWDLTYKVK